MNIFVSKTNNTALKEKLSLVNLKFLELVDCTNGKKVKKPARVSLVWSNNYLYVYFWVEDEHIWGTYKKDNDPIYNEEVVEVFLSFGENLLRKYLELQFSPNAVKYCAMVDNPTGSRNDAGFKVRSGIKIEGLEFAQEVKNEFKSKNYKSGIWKTIIKIPAQAIKGSFLEVGDKLRANFYRTDGYPKQSSFQALSPNLQNPPDFHVPEKFATLVLEK